jgi:hypothetical protein
MKIIYNVEFSHVKEVVISRKVFYVKDECLNFNLDDSRTDEEIIERREMPKTMSSDDMADYVRDYIGRRKWKIVLSSGTINIFKPGKHKPEEPTSQIVIKFKSEEKSDEKKSVKMKKGKN